MALKTGKITKNHKKHRNTHRKHKEIEKRISPQRKSVIRKWWVAARRSSKT